MLHQHKHHVYERVYSLHYDVFKSLNSAIANLVSISFF